LGLTEHAYAAALDESLWPAWVEAMVRHFEARGAVFGLVDTGTGAIRAGHFHFPDGDFDRLIAEYSAAMAGLDPIFRRIRNAGGSEIFDDSIAVDPDDPNDQEFCRWQEAVAGIGRNLTASLALGGDLQGGIALNWSRWEGSAGQDKRRWLAELSPHISAAMRLGLRHNELVQQAWWDGRMGDQNHAALLIDDNGRIIRMSPRAEAILSAADGLGCVGGRLRAASSACDDRLAARVAQATRTKGALAATVSLVRPSGRPAYRLAISPLVRRRRFLAPNEAAAIIQILDTETAAIALSPLQRSLFGLTEREAQVADLLLAGHSLDSLSEVLGIRRNTARNHLQALFAKTGTNRQSHLVRLLIASRQQLRDS
jgi:DNA-binding CsgD family transcriptional regulator